ncbi:peptidyl-prolyl cis-trans isomerase A (cyclophilin A) [Pilibacter termitis]|uniref:Peptidyl-prolyl cis-trans isomerase n=1 Tax=Pilibacter termitis TaxID=263852 RepID=A0A1T4N9R6_9ENTE|nr:peptidylprolyl isomerase [Pilibacter termitis]SJZ75961.1 peptidyl-prolyl cis-trans isomerase A (cyclophilin A) [Pilibacter termitis]
MKSKKLMLAGVSLMTVALLTACSTNKTDNSSTSSSTSETKELSEKELNKLDLPQLTETVAKDESLVEMKTTEGDIQIKLFPKYAPLAVENFITHAKEGYYNNVVFHRVMKDFMIQGGDPKGDGTGGESIWKGKDEKKDSGNGFKNEISPNLYNLRGALSMANAGPDTNGSQFFINTNTTDQSANLAVQFTPEKIIEAYKKGGNSQLDGSYTVFGQVVKGMDVVDKIASQPVEENGQEKSKPVTPVKITGIDILQEAK